MNNKLVLGFLIFVLVIGLTFFVRINQNNWGDNLIAANPTGTQQLSSQNNSDVKNSLNSTSGDNSPTNSGKITLSELANHDSLNDCWIVYDGKVYDITDYLPRHPGSAEKILPYCGSATEFENAFVRQHGTSKVSLLMKVGVFIGNFDIVGNI